MVLTFCYVCFQSIYFSQIAIRFGRLDLIYLTFTLALIIDNTI